MRFSEAPQSPRRVRVAPAGTSGPELPGLLAGGAPYTLRPRSHPLVTTEMPGSRRGGGGRGRGGGRGGRGAGAHCTRAEAKARAVRFARGNARAQAGRQALLALAALSAELGGLGLQRKRATAKNVEAVVRRLDHHTAGWPCAHRPVTAEASPHRAQRHSTGGDMQSARAHTEHWQGWLQTARSQNRQTFCLGLSGSDRDEMFRRMLASVVAHGSR